MIKNGKYDFRADVIGIIYPVYDWGLPKLVRTFLEKVTIKASYIFVIATYGDKVGNSLYEVEKVLRKKGIETDYYEGILMVDNYLPLFDINSQIEKYPQKRVEENLNRIIQEVKNKQRRAPRKSLIWSGVTNTMKIIQPLITNNIPKWIYKINDDCVSCGICSKVCPTNNVMVLDKQKPKFGRECESCFACVHNCPQNAIHLSIERSGARFRNENILLKEIIDSNNQL